jgi:hypothetical protein
MKELCLVSQSDYVIACIFQGSSAVRRDQKLAHPEASASEAVRVGSGNNEGEPRRGDTSSPSMRHDLFVGDKPLKHLIR